MHKTLVLYPAIAMMVLNLFLFAKNYFDNVIAKKAGDRTLTKI